MELKDLLTGAAFPLIVLLVFSTTIIMFADFDELPIALLALIGGELMTIVSFIAFGRYNGMHAYTKFVTNETMRSAGSKDKNVVYATGEYALWKGFAIGLITAIPYILIELVHCIYPNLFCEFMLKYACGWAYFPCQLANIHHAIGLVFVVIPTVTHAIGYVIGKNAVIKENARQAAENEKAKSRKKKR